VVAVVDGDGQLLELAVDRRVVEGDALDSPGFDDLEHVGPGEVGGRLVEDERQGIGQGVSGSFRRHRVILLVERSPREGEDSYSSKKEGKKEGVRSTFYPKVGKR